MNRAPLLWTLAALLAAVPCRAAEPQPILDVDAIRPGMTGYGLSVFHGTQIEPFAVEVISVEHDFRPGQSVIWVRCPDERMQKSGPVQGMSGSPIYLWTDEDPAESRVPGRGGKLIGAFAFGFSGIKDCYVGVQPIALMRAAADRADVNAVEQAQASMAGRASETLAQLLSVAEAKGLPDQLTWRAQALAKFLPAGPDGHIARPLSSRDASADLRGPAHLAGRVQPLMLPLSVGSARIADVLSPMLAPMGIMPLAGAAVGSTAGKPPPGVDLDQIKLEPGSVLAVPLAFGDVDLSAAGTVTEVLPDGRVLGFGHSMFGQGPAAVPMATGYVHMVMPHILISFKLGGSGVIKGALVRDEHVGVIGTPEGKFVTVPAKVAITAPGLPRETFEYQMVHHRRLIPALSGLAAAVSMTGRQDLPDENTTRFRGTLRFTGGRELKLDALVPFGSEMAAFYELVPPVTTLVQNPFQPVQLEALELEIDVESKVRVGRLVDARLLQSQVAPGDTLQVAVRIQPYGAPIFTQILDVPIPQTLPEGDYPLLICDPRVYYQALMAARPHRLRVRSLDELFQSVQEVMSLPDTAVYTLLEQPEQGLAVGRRELPSLPSSRKAIIGAPTSTLATPYVQWAQTVTLTDMAIEGQLAFTIPVRHRFGIRPNDQ